MGTAKQWLVGALALAFVTAACDSDSSDDGSGDGASGEGSALMLSGAVEAEFTERGGCVVWFDDDYKITIVDSEADTDFSILQILVRSNTGEAGSFELSDVDDATYLTDGFGNAFDASGDGAEFALTIDEGGASGTIDATLVSDELGAVEVVGTWRCDVVEPAE